MAVGLRARLPNATVFNEALRTVLKVSKSDPKQMMAEERTRKENSVKAKPGPKPKQKG